MILLDFRIIVDQWVVLFNLYSEYIMWKVELDDSQAGIKIAGRNINNLRYADNTTLMAESEEELKSLLMRVKESPRDEAWLPGGAWSATPRSLPSLERNIRSRTHA